jgi:DHA2 family methylenomycin A resistance protein-like MFS transporter
MVEFHAEAPLIEVGLFRNASFTASNLVVFAAQFTKIAIIITGALYLQHALQMSALAAGVALLGAVAPELFVAAPIGRLADRFGARRPALAGLALTVAALLWIGLATAWDSYALLLPALVVWGLRSRPCSCRRCGR